MARENPRKALAALLPLPLSCGDYEGAPVVRPMTLGMWAALERIGSPLVTCEEPKDVMDLMPSLYLITHDPREVFAGNVLDAAMRWADTLPVGALDMIREAAYRQMNAAFDVIPEEGESKKKKTDGWLAFLAQWCAETYGWSYGEILWGVPLSAVCLFRRSEGLKADRIMPLQAVEEIDDGEEADSRG